MRILVTPTSFQPGHDNPMLERLQEFADELVFNPTGKPLQPEQLLPLLQDCDGYVAGFFCFFSAFFGLLRLRFSG